MPATTIVTSAQFLAMPEEYDQHGNRIKDELIAGEIVRVPPPSLVHDLIKNQISELLQLYFRSQPELGLRPLVEVGFEISAENTLTPDVCIIRKERLLAEDRIVRGAPEVAIEVISPSDTAVHIKAKVSAYLRSGSQSVWVAYPEDQSVVVHTSSSVRELKGEQIIDDSLLPGFSTPVSAFFA